MRHALYFRGMSRGNIESLFGPFNKIRDFWWPTDGEIEDLDSFQRLLSLNKTQTLNLSEAYVRAEGLFD